MTNDADLHSSFVRAQIIGNNVSRYSTSGMADLDFVCSSSGIFSIKSGK